jgi:hypothetical protein
VSLLKRVKKANRKRSRLKELLILSCRILLIAFLVFAFARPYIPTGITENQTARNIVGIYIDNSYSMNAEGAEGRALESAKQKAYAIVNGSRPDTRFLLLNNNLDDSQNRFFSHSEIISLISDTEISHNWVDLSTVQLRFISLMEDFLFDTNRFVYMISDFQKYSSDFENFRNDSLIAYHFLPIPVNEVANLYIDTCWFESPTHHLGQAEILNVKIVNNSVEDYYQVPVNLLVNDTLKALASADIGASEEVVLSMEYTNHSTGLQFGKVEITDYPIIYDNTLYFAYNVKNAIDVLLINQNINALSRNMSAMFSGDDYVNFNVSRWDRLQISSLDKYSVVFINEMENISTGLIIELEKYVETGGNLVFVPGTGVLTETYNTLLEAIGSPLFSEPDTTEIPLSEVPYNHSLYSNVFSDQTQNVEMPLINYRYRILGGAANSGSRVLSFADQTNALTLNNHGNGKVFSFSFPVSNPKNSFIDHLLFFPTFYNIVLQSANTQQIYYETGRNRSFELTVPGRSQSANFTLRHEQSGSEFMPSIINQRGNSIRMAIDNSYKAGYYKLMSDFTTEKGIAFNYQLKESDFEYYSGNEVIRMVQAAGVIMANLITVSSNQLQSEIEDIDKGKEFWRLFVILGLFFLAVEAAIIRLWP